MLEDFVQLWSAKERGRDGLVPESFADDENRRRLREASTARALCIAAVVELALLLFVATSLPRGAMAVGWAIFAATLLVALVLAARSLSALARAEVEGVAEHEADGAPEDRGDEPDARDPADAPPV